MLRIEYIHNDKSHKLEIAYLGGGVCEQIIVILRTIKNKKDHKVI